MPNEKVLDKALDEACNKLRVAILNPLALARYMTKKQAIEETWKDLAKKKHVHYCSLLLI